MGPLYGFGIARRIERMGHLLLNQGTSNSAWSHDIDFKRHADLFEGFGFLMTTHKPMQTGEEALRARGVNVSADLFLSLKVKPVLGAFSAYLKRRVSLYLP